MAKKLQLLRNQTIFENKAAALAGLKAKLVSAEPILAAGEPLIASYTDGEKVSILLGISYGDGENYQIFEGAKIGADGNLEIPKEVQDAIKDAVDGIIGGALEGYDTLGEIETLIKGLQTEIDTTQKGAGLGTDGTYTAKGDANYIRDATSLKSADEALDAALKAEEIDRTSKDTELEGKLNDLTETVTKNKVIAGDGITVNTEGENTVVSAKVKADNNALKVNPTDGLYVDESALEKYQGTNAIVVSEAQDGIKTISLTIDGNDKVLSQSTTGLIANINLTWNKVEGLKLVGKGSTVIATIPSEDFIKDGMLEDVELVQLTGGTGANPSGLTNGTYLHFIFNTESGKEEIYVNVTSLIDIYTAGNGISVDGKVISAKIDAASDTFLTVGADGIKLSGVQAAIDKIEASVGLKEDGSLADPSGNYTAGSTTVMNAISKLDTQVKANADALSTANNYTVNGYKISENPVLNGGDIELDGYTRSELTNKALNIAPTDTVNVGFGKLEKAILDNEEVCSKAFDEVATAVGLNREGMTYVVPTGTTYISASTSVQDADIKLDAAIKAVDDKVVSEVDKAYLDGVVAGNGIAVTEKASNKQTISAKAVVSDPIIEVTENGIGTKTDAVWDCGTY